MLDYSNISVPRLARNQIVKFADDFRNKYQPSKPSPLKIIDILEFDLKIQIIPSPGLEAYCGADAFMTSSWKYLFIDQRQYENEAYDKRINFSVSHEIGHFVMHQELYASFQINDSQDIYRFFQEFPEAEYQELERQVDLFAASLLVPDQELRQELNINLAKIKNGHLIKEELGSVLSDKFAVSKDVIYNRIFRDRIFNREELERLMNYLS